MRHLAPIFILALSLVTLPFSATAQDDAAGSYFTVDRLNSDALTPPDDMDLTNPRGLVRSFLEAVENEDFDKAASAIRRSSDDGDTAPDQMARMLGEVIERQLWIDGGSLPDRPDALIEPVGDNPRAGQPRRSIALGTVPRGDFPVTIRINRYKTETSDPVWLFSEDTADAIPALYALHGPGWIEQALPEWWRERSAFKVRRWEIAALPVLVGCAALLAWIIAKLISWLQGHSGSGWTQRAVRDSRLPLAIFGATTLTQTVINGALGFSGEITSILTPLLIIGITIAFVIAVLRVIDAGLDVVTHRYVGEIDDGLSRDDRHFYTSIYALRRVITLLAFFVGTGLVLWELGIFRNVGISLLASAGVATVILGLAAQTVLGNIIASLQIAIAKPIRIGDSVNYEGDWAYVEAIYYTYIRLRTWDDRRLLVPVKYFVSHPFENWSMIDAKLTKTFTLVLDHMTDIEALREKFLELAKDDDDVMPDEMLKMLVLDHDEDGMHCRFYATASDPTQAWDMHCRLREAMLQWISKDHPEWWPRERVSSVDGGKAAAQDHGD